MSQPNPSAFTSNVASTEKDDLESIITKAMETMVEERFLRGNGNSNNSISTTNKSNETIEASKGDEPTKPPPMKKQKKAEKPRLSVEQILELTYWDSTNAKKLFNTKENEKDAKVTVERRLGVIHKALATPTGYQSVLDVAPEHMHLLTEHEVESIKSKLSYLSIALKLALETLDGPKSWAQCCDEAVKYMKEHYEKIGGSFIAIPIKSGGLLSRLHASFRNKEQLSIAQSMTKRIRNHKAKKTKIEERHKKSLEKGCKSVNLLLDQHRLGDDKQNQSVHNNVFFLLRIISITGARNRKLKQLEKKIETLEEEKRKDEEDEDDDYDDENQNNAITRQEYEMFMRY